MSMTASEMGKKGWEARKKKYSPAKLTELLKKASAKAAEARKKKLV